MLKLQKTKQTKKYNKAGVKKINLRKKINLKKK